MSCAVKYGALARTVAALYVIGWLAACGHLPEFGLVPSPRVEERGEVRTFTALTDRDLQISHLQVKGSHNSYHRAPRFALSKQWRYTHAPLEVQLKQQGVRQIELDVRYERGQVLVGHLPLIDGRTNCKSLRRCLEALKRWSRAHPAHVPVFVFIEPKEDLVASGLDHKLDVIESDIVSALPRDMLLLPEDVVKGAPSMQQAVATRGWPTLAESRGRIAFVLFGPEKHRVRYGKGRPDLRGRTMFVASEVYRPETAIVNYDDPVRDAVDIRKALRRGMLVRTRADAALVRDPARRDAALASGAHFVTTDFVGHGQRWVDFGSSATARCNPVLAPRRCQQRSLAELDDMLWARASAR